LTAMPIDYAISALEQDAKNDTYWRFPLALQTLRAIKKTAGAKRAKGFKVVVYGY
jgi:hypothetical protein